MTMTLEKLDIGGNSGLSVSGTGRHRRHADSPCAPMMMDSFYIDIPTPSARSISPMSASVSPGKDKTFSFFKSVYRKISLKSNEQLDQLGVHGDEDSRSSSVDSCSSISDRDRDRGKDDRVSRCSSASKLQLKLSNLALSSASSDSAVSSCSRADSTKEEPQDDGPLEESSGAKENRRKSRRSSVLKLLESLAIHAPMRSRSLSCSNSSVNNLLNAKGRESRAESKCSLFSTNSASHGSSNGKDASKPPPKRILRRPVSYTYLRGISGLPTQRVPRSSVCCSYYGR
uniref:DUF4797 domain-containing protein n=1 Tax=Anopheles atroparvus TaxID=41427 RepID=A0A182JLF6_ANOAO